MSAYGFDWRQWIDGQQQESESEREMRVLKLHCTVTRYQCSCSSFTWSQSNSYNNKQQATTGKTSERTSPPIESKSRALEDDKALSSQY